MARKSDRLLAPDREDERDFVLRLLTRSHPWGYRFNPLASEGPRLTASMIRDAVAEYQNASPNCIGETGGQISLKDTWPWDAYAPVPLCFLLDAVEQGGDVASHLLNQLSVLPFWKGKIRSLHGGNWTSRVEKILATSTGRDCDYRKRLIECVKRALGTGDATSYQIAALVVANLTAVPSRQAPSKVNQNGQAGRQDPIETLFIRINSAGTRIEGEELIYSILKSAWPDAERFIQKMDFRLAQPSRIVILASRLVLSDVDAFKLGPPQTPNLARFRRLVHGVDRDCKNFKSKLLEFFETDKAGAIFRAAGDLLTNNKVCDLPTTLAVDIARQSPPDVIFLLLRWVQRMLEARHDPRELNSNAKLRLVGAITALSWFSEDEGRCLAALWPTLQKAQGKGLRSFFSRQQFAQSFKVTREGKLGLLPMVPPDILEEAINSNVFGWGFNTADGDAWNNWNWETLTDRALDEKQLGKKLSRWYLRSFKKLWKRTDQFDEAGREDNVALGSLHHEAWRSFINKLWDSKALLLFAQTEWLVKWLQEIDYDATSADQIEEADRPWDFDHIHPEKYITGKWKVPQRIRAWHGSIGNLRAWPLQANRSDGDDTPGMKLSAKQVMEEFQRFGIMSWEDLLKASFVDAEQLSYWDNSTPARPEGSGFPSGYLGKPSEYGEERKNLVHAIVRRWLRLYRHWYETLRVGDLCPLSTRAPRRRSEDRMPGR